MAAEWKVEISAPNGAKAQFVFDGSIPDATGQMTKQFGKLVDSMADHDPDPLAGIEHTAPMVQPRKQAVGRK